jgi:hypothetical protein
MSGKRVAQVLLLFKYQMELNRQMQKDGAEMELAYIQLFSTTQAPNAIGGSGMYVVSRSKSCLIVPINQIYRPVHLIPKFGSQIGATAHVYREIQSNLDRFKVVLADEQLHNSMKKTGDNSTASSSSLPRRFEAPLDSLAYSKEFYLNCWIDKDMYENIY